MKTFKGMLLGAFFGFCFSLILTNVFVMCISRIAGGFVEWARKPWEYSLEAIPFTFSFAILGYLLSKKNTISNKKLWVYSVISTLFISYYSATNGLVFVESIKSRGVLERYAELGYDLSTVSTTIDVKMTMINRVILASVLLPLAIPIQRYALKLLLLLFEKFNINIQFNNVFKFKRSNF